MIKAMSARARGTTTLSECDSFHYIILHFISADSLRVCLCLCKADKHSGYSGSKFIMDRGHIIRFAKQRKHDPNKALQKRKPPNKQAQHNCTPNVTVNVYMCICVCNGLK